MPCAFLYGIGSTAPQFESRWHHEEERFKPLFFVLDVMSYLSGMEHCINAAVIITLGIHTNIGANSLRMPIM